MVLFTNMSLANVIIKIRVSILFVAGFVQYELNQLANFISTYNNNISN